MARAENPKISELRSEEETDQIIREYWDSLGEGEIPSVVRELAARLERALSLLEEQNPSSEVGRISSLSEASRSETERDFGAVQRDTDGEPDGRDQL